MGRTLTADRLGGRPLSLTMSSNGMDFDQFMKALVSAAAPVTKPTKRKGKREKKKKRAGG